MTMRTARVATVAALLTLTFGATAFAAATPTPPPNDARDAATPLRALPASIAGTTVGATVAPTDPRSDCAREGGSVWYRVTFGATAPRRLAIQVDANGELDASVDVYIRQRSQNEPVTCQTTDKHGESVFDFTPQPHTTYLVRVAQLANSDSGSFTLQAFVPPPPARAPGPPLGAHGASGTLSRVVDTTAAYRVSLTAGVSYVLNLVSGVDGCMGLAVYPPGTRSFADAEAVTRSCQGYQLFTPRISGTYSLLVHVAGGTPGRQNYHLQLARADASQTTPGLPLPNYSDVAGTLNASHVDVVRLYRFDVTSRSDLELSMRAGRHQQFDLELRAGGGRLLDCECGGYGSKTLTWTTRPGRFYVEVRADDYTAGRFMLRRQSRTITRTGVRIDGARYVVRPPGTPVRVSVFTSAHANGPATVEIDRFDPDSGFQYNRTVRVAIRDGIGSFQFTPPSLGQWLMTAGFLGSRAFNPSVSRAARLESAGPLSEQSVFGPL